MPAPKLTWQFGGKSGSTFTPYSVESILRITNVMEKHEGKYKCVAENVAGKDEHVITLFVQGNSKAYFQGTGIVTLTFKGNALKHTP